MLNKEGRAARAVECVLSDNCLEGCVLPSRRHRQHFRISWKFILQCAGVGWDGWSLQKELLWFQTVWQALRINLSIKLYTQSHSIMIPLLGQEAVAQSS